MTDEEFVRYLNIFFKFIAPSCSYEEYKLTFVLFIFLDHFKDKLKPSNNTFSIYLSELVDGYLDPNSQIFENTYPPTGLTSKQIFKGIKLVSKRGLFRIHYSDEEKLLRVTFLGE